MQLLYAGAKVTVQEQYEAIWEKGESAMSDKQDYFREHDNTPLQIYTSPQGVVDAKMIRGWCVDVSIVCI